MIGRRVACFTAVGALIVLAGGAYVLRGRIQEEWWIRQLGSKDEADVRGALEKLGDVRSVRAIPQIVELHRERETDSRVVECAVKIGPKALAELLDAVQPSSEKLTDLLVALWKSSTPVLLECVKDERVAVVSRAAQSLQQIGAEKDREKLLAALNDFCPRVRFAAAWALVPSQARRKSIRELIVESLSDPSPTARITAVNRLRSGLLESNFNPRPNTSIEAEAQFLFSDRDHESWEDLTRLAAPGLIEALRDSELEVRRSAVTALGFSGFEEAFPALVEMLDAPEAEIRVDAGDAMVNLSSGVEHSPFRRAVVHRLLELFRGAGTKSTRIAARVLTSFGHDARAAWPELLEYWEKQPSDEAELYLTVLAMGPGAASVVPALLGRVRLDSGRDPSLIIATLGAIGAKAHAAAPILLDLLKRTGHDASLVRARRRVQFALPEVCPTGDGVLDELLLLVADGSKPIDVRCAAAITLGGFRLSTAAVLPALRAVLEDQGAGIVIRCSAAVGLGRIGRAAREASPSIEKLINLQDPGGPILFHIDPAPGLDLVMALDQIDPARDFRAVIGGVGVPSFSDIPDFIRRLRVGRGPEAAFANYPAQTLLRIGKPAVPALTQALRSDDVVVRSQAAEILGWIGPAAEEAIPHLTRALEDEDAEVRRDATKALPKVSALRDFHQPPKSPAADPPKLSPLLQDADGVAISSPDAWSRRRAELRAAWLGYLGGLPGDRGPLDLEILETEEPTKFTRQLVRYRIEDGVTTEAYLLTPWDLPADGSRKAAAVVVFHSTVDSHAGEAAGLDAYRSELAIGVHLVERGYVTLCPRCFIFDEGSDYAGNVAKMQARHPERKGMARMLLDGMRAADLLESLPHVDRDRIGCIGHSLGAKEALYAAAFDERFRASVFHEGGIGLVMSNWEAPWYLGPQIREAGFPREHHELLALVAPRAFLVVGGGEADDARSWAFVEPALGVFKLLGAESRFGWVLHDGGHNYTRFARAVAEEFLERGLR